MDSVPDPLLLRKSGIGWNRTQNYGSVARNSEHETTEAVAKRILDLEHFLEISQMTLMSRRNVRYEAGSGNS
jgi:hypothetical protein